MAILAELYFKKETLETLIKTLTAKKENGVSITVAISNDNKEFTRDDGRVIQQNGSAYVSQSKDDRDAGKDRFYVANGRKVWDDGLMPDSLKVFKDTTSDQGVDGDQDDDLPF